MLNIKEVKKPETNSFLVAENIAQQLVKRVSYRRAYGIISGSAVFSDDLLVTTLFEIRNIAYEIRDEIDLFHYNPEGGLLWLIRTAMTTLTLLRWQAVI